MHLRVFGCIAYAHIPDAARHKLDKKAEKLRFIGYSKVSKGYRLINENTKKVVIRHDVIFNETDFGLGISKMWELTKPPPHLAIISLDQNGCSKSSTRVTVKLSILKQD